MTELDTLREKAARYDAADYAKLERWERADKVTVRQRIAVLEAAERRKAGPSPTDIALAKELGQLAVELHRAGALDDEGRKLVGQLIRDVHPSFANFAGL